MLAELVDCSNILLKNYVKVCIFCIMEATQFIKAKTIIIPITLSFLFLNLQMPSTCQAKNIYHRKDITV